MKNVRVLLGLLVVAIIILYLHLTLHEKRVLGMDTSLFYLDEKVTIGAYFTSMVAMFAGITFFVKTGIQESKILKLLTLGMGSVFVMFSLDEYFELHEHLNTIIKSIIDENSYLGQASRRSWVIPLGLIVIGVFALFIFIIIKEKSKYAKWGYIIGSLALATVLLIEYIEGPSYGKDIYLYYVAVEEFMEMIAMSVFLFAALNIGDKDLFLSSKSE